MYFKCHAENIKIFSAKMQTKESYVSLGSLVAGILLTTDKLQQAVTPSVAARILRAHLQRPLP